MPLTASDLPMTRAYESAAPSRASSSYASDWKVPDRSAPPIPHSTKPSAKDQ